MSCGAPDRRDFLIASASLMAGITLWIWPNALLVAWSLTTWNGSKNRRRRIDQPMAGGELLFGVTGFDPLIRNRAVDVIMPDVKHCGGLLELTRIAAMADASKIDVAPHNPSGPVSTAASVQVCAGLKNSNFLELQWGEVDWRAEALDPPELFDEGTIRVPDQPRFGIELNERVIREHWI